MKIQFLGAAGTVTGSNYLLIHENGSQLLIDFGMYQGPEEITKLNYIPIQFDATKISGVLLTHAHLDHCGRLPLLAQNGYGGKIYMTAPTRELVSLSLTDSANVAQKNQKQIPLYLLSDVEKVVEQFEVIEYNREFSVGDFKITYRDAGHILGSGSIEIVDVITNKKIVFSGDLGNTPEDLIRPTEFIQQADYVVMESTYGDSLHKPEDVSGIIREEINIVELTQGVLLIPAFSLERTQELLHRIHHLKKSKKIKEETHVFLDSPMGIQATEIFSHFREFYNDELLSHPDNPFDFPGLVVTENGRDSRKIKKIKGSKVIIAGSGMMTGGRIVHHAKEYLSRKNTRILFVGYQAEDTNGRRILEGAKKVFIDDKPVTVNAKIREIESMSSHADQQKLLNWLGSIKGVQKVFVTHGEDNQRAVLAQKIQSDIHLEDITIPVVGQEFNL